MRKHRRLAVRAASALAAGAWCGPAAADPIPYSVQGNTYSQNFDSLPQTGTANTWTSATGTVGGDAGAGITPTLAGWQAFKSVAPNAVSVMRADDGASNTGALYSFGSTAGDGFINPVNERALGSIASATPGNFQYGVVLINNTGATLSQFTLSYTGEQWRDGGNLSGAAQKLTFDYSTNATAINDSAAGVIFTPATALDFTSPVHAMSSSPSKLDGNAAANRAAISATVTGVEWAAGGRLWLRWTDLNDTSNDHGLAIDDLSFSSGNPPVLTWIGPATNGGAGSWTAAGGANWSANGLPPGGPWSSTKNAVFSLANPGTVDLADDITALGLQFDTTGYTVASAGGRTLTLAGGLAGTNTIRVSNAGDTTTISAALGGSVGLIKTGAGVLIVSGSNSFTGDVKVSAGTLSIADNAALGAAANNLMLGGGTLRVTAPLTIGSGHTLSGTGTIDQGANALTFTGPVSGATLTLTGTGGVSFANTGSALVALTVTNPMTVSYTGAMGQLVVGDVSLQHTAGTVTFAGPWSFGGSEHTLTVADGTAVVDLQVNGTLSSAGGRMIKLGPGTAALAGGNPGLTGGVQIGKADAAAPIAGGTLIISSNTALGPSGATLLFHNGTLQATTPLTGGNALPVGLTIAAGNNAGPAIFTGSDMEFTGPVSLAKAGNSLPQRITVNNTTTLSGAWTTSGGVGATNTVTIDGTGTLVLTNSASTFLEPLTVAADATLLLTADHAMGSNTGTTVSAGGTLALMPAGGAPALNYTPTNTGAALSGAGVGGNGALRNLAGTNTFAAGVSAREATIRIEAGSSLKLTGFLNTLVNGDAGHALTKSGAGTLTIAGTQFHNFNSSLTISEGTLDMMSNTGPDAFVGRYSLAINVTPATGSSSLRFDNDGTAGSVDKFAMRTLAVNAPGDGRGDGLVILGAGMGGNPSPATGFGGPGGSVRVYLGNGAGNFGAAPRATVEKLWDSMVFDGWWALQTGFVTAVTRGVTFDPGIVTNTARNGLALVGSFDDDFNTVTYLGENILGDANGDGAVDSADITLVLQHLNKAPGMVAGEGGFMLYTWGEGDFNGDESVDSADVTLALSNLGKSYNPALGGGGATAVPEPAAIGILIATAPALLRRRRHKRTTARTPA